MFDVAFLVEFRFVVTSHSGNVDTNTRRHDNKKNTLKRRWITKKQLKSETKKWNALSTFDNATEPRTTDSGSKEKQKKNEPTYTHGMNKNHWILIFPFRECFFLSVCIKSYRLFSLLLWMWWKDKTTMKCTFKVRFDHLNKRREEEVCKGHKSVV